MVKSIPWLFVSRRRDDRLPAYELDDTDTPHLSRRQEKSLDDICITPERVEQKLRGLRITSSPGPDGFHPRILKELASVLSVPLCKLFQKSMETGVLPVDWKVAEVVPIFKKGSRSKPSNYRPVSLTAIPCKVMESVLRDSIVAHMVETGQLNQAQHGFVEKRSCTTQLLASLDCWTKALEVLCGSVLALLLYSPPGWFFLTLIRKRTFWNSGWRLWRPERNCVFVMPLSIALLCLSSPLSIVVDYYENQVLR